MTGAGRYRLSADIGGTFTDLILSMQDGSCLTCKVLSTPDDYARGIMEGLALLLRGHAIDPIALEEVVHGTTVATNAILEGRGARTALLTTRGFRDVLELRRLRVPQLYDLAYRPPQPMVDRRLRIEVDERIGPDGEVIRPLDEDGVLEAVDRMREDGVEAVAVTLIHSYRNPVHEVRIGELLRELMPGTPVSLSVEVLPEIREYERTSTTVINSYLAPMVRRYLESLGRRLKDAGIRAPLHVIQSNGGIMSARSAALKPVHIVESGPAAGVIAAQAAGERALMPNLITFDMGGTTAKASIIEAGQVSRTTEYEVGAGISLSSRLVKGAGHALKLPVLDIAEVGAGGGSVLWMDSGGSLKVGPRSAGALPGPACYGRGGEEPTVTDASVVLGYINPGELAGGALKLRPELAERAVSGIAQTLQMSLPEAAFGAHAIVNANMMRAIKAVSTYRGRDPRDFTLLAFGGSGPIHAAAIARELGIERVVVPAAPGLFSAMGLLEAQTEHHVVQTLITRIGETDAAALEAAFADLEASARRLLQEDDHGNHEVCFQRLADLRYVGQAYELTVAVPGGTLVHESVLELAEGFGSEHERTYGHRARREPVELVNLRLVARIIRAPRAPSRLALTRGLRGRRRAYFGPREGAVLVPVVGRGTLSAKPSPGPLIVEDYDATTVIPPDCTARLDAWQSIVIEVGGEG